jgi:formylglycine-generating enzyme required for sulfatase activity
VAERIIRAQIMIAFTCASCRKRLSARDEQAGKRVKCPGCGQAVTVPQGSESLAGQHRSGSVSLEDARTLPPEAPSGPQVRTLPPSGASRHDHESRSDAGSHTAGGPAAGGAGGNRELYDFLAPAQQPDEIGRLGAYRVLKVLGHGGMGVVFQAEDPSLKRKVAIKAMLPALAASDSARQRFLREAQTAAAIEHDHIVPIYQVGEDRGVPFIAMPFLKGEPLDARLKRERMLSVAEVVRIGREAAKGLAAAHAAGLVHRDIKPANLWLEGEEGRVKVLDFGLARAASDDGQLTQQGAILGTPAYMAPEQGAGQPVDGRCDLFSLGCVLYCLATGQLPFRGSDPVSTLVAVATHEPPPPAELRRDLPGDLSDLVMRLLEKRPEARPQSALAVVEALQKFEAHSGGGPEALTDAEEPAGAARTEVRTHFPVGNGATEVKPACKLGRQEAKSSSALPWLVGGGVLGAGVLALLLVFLLRPGGSKTAEDGQVGEVDPGPAKQAVKPPEVAKGPDKLKGPDRPKEPDRQVVQPAGQQTATLKNSLGMEFVRVPKGQSWLGGGGGKAGTNEVHIDDDFYLGKYEVTQEEWLKVMGNNPSLYKSLPSVSPDDQKRFPVENVSWDDTQVFLRKLNEQVRDPGWVYRLPTSTEWEYACRGGPMKDRAESEYHYYLAQPSQTMSETLANIAVTGVRLRQTRKVGSYPANRLGLHDMHGNVWEWCHEMVIDPRGQARRVRRGGSCASGSERCQATSHLVRAADNRQADIGFRVARVVTPKGGPPPPPKVLPQTFRNRLGMEMVRIPRGKFWKGGGDGKPGNREVEIAREFYLCKHEVTQEVWQALMKKNPSWFSRSGKGKEAVKNISDADLAQFPVERVTWHECQEFLLQLNKMLKDDSGVYRLPTTTELEYACRGGPNLKREEYDFDYYFDVPSRTQMPGKANLNNAVGRTCKVGSYPPNRLGLYDMHGNVNEWCSDGFDSRRRAAFWGGGWETHSEGGKAGQRGWAGPSDRHKHLGLRVAFTPIGAAGK